MEAVWKLENMRLLQDSFGVKLACLACCGLSTSRACRRFWEAWSVMSITEQPPHSGNCSWNQGTHGNAWPGTPNKAMTQIKPRPQQLWNSRAQPNRAQKDKEPLRHIWVVEKSLSSIHGSKDSGPRTTADSASEAHHKLCPSIRRSCWP